LGETASNVFAEAQAEVAAQLFGEDKPPTPPAAGSKRQNPTR
jgi:hypothetical protein